MTKVSLLKYFLAFYLLHDRQQTEANKCDEDFFYRPYVVVKKKNNGADLAAVRTTGFLDLRFRTRVLLCMNGPVVLYSYVEKLDSENRLQNENDQSRQSLQTAPKARNPSPTHGIDAGSEEELRFGKGELVVYSHECISINKVPINLLKKLKEEQGRALPELNTDTPVTGKLVLGVYLIGNKESYRKPEMAWFKFNNYDYIRSKDKTVKDSSFIIANGQESSHCIRLPDGTHVKIRGPASKNGSIEVCRWTVKESDKPWYSKIFQRGYDANGFRTGEATLQESDYEFYECPDGDPDRTIVLTMALTTPEPASHTNYTEFDSFSLFNPNIWTPHGFRRDSNGLSGGDERTEDRSLKEEKGGVGDSPCSSDPTYPGCEEDTSGETTTARDMQNVLPLSSSTYEIVAGECVPMPELKIGSCDCSARNGDRLLELTLELVPLFPEPEPPSAPAAGAPEAPAPAPAPGPPGAEPMIIDDAEKVSLPKWGNLDSNEHLKWKMDILNLVADVFSNLCMPFRADFPYTVARVFGWYLLRAHAYGENMGRLGAGCQEADETVSSKFDHLIKETDTWIILRKELERCVGVAKGENGGKGFKFQWEVAQESGKWKIPAVDGRPTRRRRRSVDQSEYPSFSQRMSLFTNQFFAEGGTARREKRAAPINHTEPRLSKKYVLPGKSLSFVKSEGNIGYAREAIQEFKFKPNLNDPRGNPESYCEYPENIQHCHLPVVDQVTKKVTCSEAEDIFFYEDRAEIELELNIVIDLWWKIWATSLGYCNKAYQSRKSETFPRLYNSKFEHFFEPVMKEWKTPQDNEDLKIIFSEYLTEENHVWIDACVEASYINSKSHSYRPPRPMNVEGHAASKEVANFFEEIPTYLYYRYHPEPTNTM